jgi:hypothetical protein
VKDLVVGMLGMGFAVAGMFFLRFWRETRDRLFGFFALAFFVLAAERLGFVTIPSRDSEGTYLDWVRLAAFAIILLAIADKNVRREPRER